ncbi:hypothetical protein J1605_000783 [Eschrichtius robustus]|uniref:Uncharacterized protein n=1 Tax=Eschrichtius robustus TaxID=9764 RepID=A0AB34GPU0_ESCRO|nr:hypothetical protein J1605_000783 [Eschrichtius robustus]
MGAAPPAVL